jgi:hypothetical protein
VSEQREQLAERLCKMMQTRRLERIGERVPQDSVPFHLLPESERRNWLDLADCVSEIVAALPPTAKLRRLLDDFDRYAGTLVADRDWREQMLRAVILEIRIEVAKLEQVCERP